MKKRYLIITLLIIFILILTYFKINPKSKNNQESLHVYGPDSNKNVFRLILQDNHIQQKKLNLVMIVHGGGFIGGDIEVKNMQPLYTFFLERGYSIASIDYRLCPDVKWPTPIEDIANGIQTIQNYLKDNGFTIQSTTYVGFSAGSTSGALIFYSDKYPSVSNINKFISISGVYNPYSVTPVSSKTTIACDIQDLQKDFIYNGKTHVPALLIEGESDVYDTYPLTNNSHMEYLAQILRKNSIPVKTYWAHNANCGHICPINLIRQKQSEITKAIDDFLKEY